MFGLKNVIKTGWFTIKSIPKDLTHSKTKHATFWDLCINDVGTDLLKELTQFKCSKQAAVVCTPIRKDLAGKKPP